MLWEELMSSGYLVRDIVIDPNFQVISSEIGPGERMEVAGTCWLVSSLQEGRTPK